MGDSFLNILFIIAVVAVFIVRTISSAKKKKEPEPKEKIPVHFEDEDDEDPSYFKNKAAEETIKTIEKKASAAPPPKGGVSRPTAAPVELQKGFPNNLNKLSPLKQAVVMAEILGPPKGLQ